MPTVIDSLQIEIQSGSADASEKIDKLAGSLERLRTNGKLTTVTKNLTALSTAVKGLSGISGSASSLYMLATAVERLRNIKSIASLTNNLSKLPAALKGIENMSLGRVEEQIRGIASAVRPLTEIKTSGFASMVNGMAKIDKVTRELDDTKINAFAERVKKLNDLLGPLSEKMATIGPAFRAISSGAAKAAKDMGNLDHGIKTTTLNLSSMIHVVQTVVSAIATAVRTFTDITAEAIEWDGIAARFGRTFGAQAQKTYEWIQRLNEEMDINVQQFMQYGSLYAQMLTGFGVASEDSAKMALGYTELTYDIWAAANDRYKTFADAAEAVASAIAGEVEPIRRAGFTIIESTLEQTAANHGLNISLEKATEAQKSYLRYLTLVDQAHSTGIIGSYARELNTAEGMTRALAQQIKSLTQAFGSLFLPVLVKIMPYIQAFVELLTDAVHAVAAFFGVEIQDIRGTWGDFTSGADAAADGANAVTDALGNAAEAAKDLKNATLGIDELNVISPKTSSNSGSGSGGDSGAGFDGIDVNSLWDQSIFDSIQSDVERIKGVIVDALTAITGIASGFALAIGTILVVTGANIPLGLGLMAVGAIGLATAVAVNWDTMSNELAQTLTTITATVGGFLLAVGAVLAFSGANIPLGIGLMAAGAVSVGTAVAINWNKLNGDIENTIALISGTVGGALLGLGAIMAFSGVNIPLGIAFMAAGAAGLATSVAINWDGLSNEVKGAIADVEAAVGGGLLAVGALLAFTGIAIPLGIALMAAGAVSIASAVALNWDALTSNVKNTVKTLSSIMSGSLLAVGGLLAFTGVNIPLGIALMAIGAVTLAGTVALNWNSLDPNVKKTIQNITTAVSAGLLAIGAVLAFTGVATLLGISLLAAGAVGLVSTVALNWNTITTKVKSVVKDIGAAVGVGLIALGAILCLSGVALPLGLAMLAAGGVSLVSSVALNWNALRDRVKEAWGKVTAWWNKKDPLKKITTTIESVKDRVSSAWNSARTWWNDKKTAMKKYTPDIGSILDKVKDVWTTAKNWWNNNVKGLKLDIKTPKIKLEWTSTTVLGKTFKYPTGFDVYFAANGGIFDAGSLIWAGERGAEIVANAGGGKTGVMNVDQMQEAVYEGVYAAMSAAMSKYSGGGSQGVNVYLDSRQITSSVEQRQREKGASIMGNEVFA